MKNHYFLTQTRKSNSYLLVTVLGYYRLKHINSKRNLESDMQMKQNRRILPRIFLEVTKSKQLSLFRVKYIHILMTSVTNIQGITNICLFYNLNFGQRAHWIYETEARTKNSNLLYSNLSLKKINEVLNVILYQPWRNFSLVYGNFYASSLWEASNFYSITAMVTILLFM